VLRAACEYAGRLRDPALKPAVLKVVASARENFTINAANSAAVALGAKAEACEIWIDRLDEPRIWPAMSFLATIVKYPGHGTGANTNVEAEEIAALKRRWQEFLPLHRERIASGRLFEIGDPELTPDLFGRIFHFGTKDGAWPPRQD
jgi:hypothetical protein